MTQSHSALYLIPVALADSPWQHFLPAQTQNIASGLQHFIVENARTARAHLKLIDHPGPLRSIDIKELPERPSISELDTLLAPLFENKNIGLMSDAGCPAVADPGARVVARAHKHGFTVVPLIGPSSILLGLMGSGLNGQGFTFHGYLPVNEHERNKRIQILEKESKRVHRTQIFIETPYRNERLFEALLQCCQPQTQLCIARDLTGTAEYLRTQTIAAWQQAKPPTLARHPALFLLQAE